MAKRSGLKSLFKPKFLVGLFCVVSMIVLWNFMSKNREGLDSGKELVLVHMNNCGYCKKMMPEWKKCKKENNTGITMLDYEMNSSNGKDLVNKYNIKGFPTILLIENGKKLDTYDGERTSESILEFMKNAD